jgi:hypothetical protein
MNDEEQEAEVETEVEEPESHYEIDPKLKALLERGYAAREAREEMDRRVGDVVEEMNRAYPDQSKTLRSVLDGHRQRLLAEYEQKKRAAYAAAPSKGKGNDGEDGKGAEVSGGVCPVQDEQPGASGGEHELHSCDEGGEADTSKRGTPG